MLLTAINFLKNLKLSVTDWALVTATAALAGLVAAFEIQGSALHKAQVALLKQTLDSKEAQASKDTEDALKAYVDARRAFLKAGGTLLLVLALISAPMRGYCGSKPDLLPKCELTLAACNKAVEAQGNEITGLKQDVKKLEGSLNYYREGSHDIPSWGYVLFGIVAGYMATRALTK